MNFTHGHPRLENHGDGQSEPPWLEEQISLFTAATGVKVGFSPSSVADLLVRLPQFCGVYHSGDGALQKACQAWHQAQCEKILHLSRASLLQCPMQLHHLWAPVAKGGEVYGFLYSEPMMQDGQPGGHGRVSKSPDSPKDGAGDLPSSARKKSKLYHHILKVKVARSDGILVLLELMGQRLGARFHQERRLPAPCSPSEVLVRRAAAVLCSCYHEDVSTSDIADRLHVSESHLCHAFREVTDGTLREYLNELRFTEACRMLKECPHLKVAEVAFAAGFQSLSRFSEQFRQRGLPSPGKWRQCEVLAHG